MLINKLFFVFVCIIFGCAECQHVNRIINGTKIEKPDQLSRVMVSIQHVSNESHICGGTILTSNLVLTAAHCLVKYTPDQILIRTSTLHSQQGGRKYKAQRLIKHENFDMGRDLRNDIGIIKVKPDFFLTDGEEKVKLPERYEKFTPGTTTTVIGWGRINQLQRSSMLRKVDQKVIDNYECSKQLDHELYPGELCAGTPGNHKGFCKGDSGGPVFINGTQVGIVSWYIGKCGDGPNVYSNIAFFKDWITATIGLHRY